MDDVVVSETEDGYVHDVAMAPAKRSRRRRHSPDSRQVYVVVASGRGSDGFAMFQGVARLAWSVSPISSSPTCRAHVGASAQSAIAATRYIDYHVDECAWLSQPLLAKKDVIPLEISWTSVRSKFWSGPCRFRVFPAWIACALSVA